MNNATFPVGSEREEKFLCSYVNSDTGERCKAYRVKNSRLNYCRFHCSQFEKEALGEFYGSIIDAMEDEKYFGSIFQDQKTWRNWKVVLKSIFCLKMDKEERRIYQQLSNRKVVPQEQPREIFLVIGRRGGKSFIVSLIAVYLAFFKKYGKYLQGGERGFITILASDRSQTQIIMGYIKALLQLSAFATHIERESKEQVDLDNRISITVKTCSVASPRGLTSVCVIGDEVSFWRGEDSVNPDKEIYTALTPTGLTIPGFMMLFISTPYTKAGLLYEKHQKYFGVKNKNTLVIQAPSQLMNPTLPSKIIAEELEKDPEGARSEYLGIFREDVSGWLDFTVIENSIVPGRGNQPRNPNFRYLSFCDGSGGGGGDSFTLAIGHVENNMLIIDFVNEWRVPFSPKKVVEECAEHLKSYALRRVVGDKFSPGLLKEEFGRNGIYYDYSSLTASEIYQESSYLFNQGAVELPDMKRLEAQLKSLEKKTRRGGKDLISHPNFKGSHDDLANAVCGCLMLLVGKIKKSIDDLPLPPDPRGMPQKRKDESEVDCFMRLLRGGHIQRDNLGERFFR